MKLSFVIPVYRNAGSIKPTHEKLIALLTPLQIIPEFIFVNDGSDDTSIDELLLLHEKDSSIKVICFSRNFPIM